MSGEARPAGNRLQEVAVEPLLEVRNLHVEFRTLGGVVSAVNGVSYSLSQGETLGILGESGSGKSVSSEAVMGIVDSPPGFVTGGEIVFRGQDLLTMSSSERRRVRGRHIAMIFQDALTALNPGIKVGLQIAEMFRVHVGMSRKDSLRRATELLDRVGIPAAKSRVHEYPHQFSGGMRQRVMIAMAIALDPDVLIADEPTTALDVTVQAQIMDLLAEIQSDTGMGMVLISHDLAVLAEVADRVAVMYAGKIIETGPIDEVHGSPAHPYTRGLIASVPKATPREGRLVPIVGSPPSLRDIPPGCAFHTRCALAIDACRTEVPLLRAVTVGRGSACHRMEEVVDGATA